MIKNKEEKTGSHHFLKLCSKSQTKKRSMLHESHVTVQKTKCANISVQFSYIKVCFFNWHVGWIDHEDQSLVERTNTSWGEQFMSFLLLLPLCTSPTLHLANTQFSYPVCIHRSAVMQDFRALITCSLSFPKSFVFSYMLGLSGIVLAFLNSLCKRVNKRHTLHLCPCKTCEAPIWPA